MTGTVCLLFVDVSVLTRRVVLQQQNRNYMKKRIKNGFRLKKGENFNQNPNKVHSKILSFFTDLLFIHPGSNHVSVKDSFVETPSGS